ncbi:MAG: helix-turn-helix domain-containing protein [Victivallaceae bacterium]|nr:helix-turn-helix domain-containing protein [Victivallaceae bacterium]
MKSALTTAFGRQLKSALAAVGLRQNELADRMGLTASAVSQIVNGVLMPSRENLDRMMRYLGDSAEADALPSLWQRIRLGDREVFSRVNRALRNARRRRKLSIVHLADLCGISAERIRQLETDPDALPREGEIAALTAVLPVEPKRLRPRRDDLSYSPEAAPLSVAADAGGLLPLLSETALLSDYRPEKESLAAFAARTAEKTLPCCDPAAGAVAAVALDASVLGLDADGIVLALLGDETQDARPDLYLTAAKGKTALKSGSAAARMRNAEWKLPVPEIIFYPARRDF